MDGGRIGTLFFSFFLRAGDGIRDATVTGVQTCALPISGLRTSSQCPAAVFLGNRPKRPGAMRGFCLAWIGCRRGTARTQPPDRRADGHDWARFVGRSEERRGGAERGSMVDDGAVE